MVKIIWAYGILFRFGSYSKIVWWPAWPWRLAFFLRRLLPYFVAVGYCDCDTGGRVFSWRPAFALNGWHADRVYRDCDYLSDGIVWNEMPFTYWLNWRLWLWWHNMRCNYVGTYHTADKFEFYGQRFWR